MPAAAFADAVRQIPVRRWLGLTATPYRRDKLDDLIAMHVGPVRHTIAGARETANGTPMLPGTAPAGGRPAPILRLHPTRYCYTGDASPSAPGGITVIYKDLIADERRTRQVIADVMAALSLGRNCLVLTNWTAHLDKLADALRAIGHDPVILRGGMGAPTLNYRICYSYGGGRVGHLPDRRGRHLLRELQESDPKTADLVDDAIYTLSRSGPALGRPLSTPSPTRRSLT